MDPAIGRFTQQDKFDGFTSDPLSLHKYTANHNDPANRVDPTGNISTLVELGTANQVLASLMRTTFTVMNYIDRVNSMVGVIQAFWEISNLLQNPMAFQDASNFLNSSDPSFMSLIQQNFSDAVYRFRRNSGKIFASTIRNYSSDIANTIVGSNQAGQERGFLIFLPTPTVISNAVKIDFPMGRINAKGKTIRILGRVGGPAKHRGRVIGLGSSTGTAHYQQYFRMDYDTNHGHHGVTTPDSWTDGNFHFHTK